MIGVRQKRMGRALWTGYNLGSSSKTPRSARHCTAGSSNCQGWITVATHQQGPSTLTVVAESSRSLQRGRFKMPEYSLFVFFYKV